MSETHNSARPLKYAIVVHGRFFAFDLVRAMIRRGSEVVLLTNYPKWAVRRFGVSPEVVQSFWPHGVLTRGFSFLHERLQVRVPEAFLHKLFGRWASSKLTKSDIDVIFCFSGIAEEAFRALQCSGKTRLLARCSSHIVAQKEILENEARKHGLRAPDPSDWMIKRELREYSLSDAVVVPSNFALDTFRNAGFSWDRLRCLPLGSDLSHFRASRAVFQERLNRLVSGQPIRAIYVGTISYQKGAVYLLDAIKAADKTRFHFRVVGPVDKRAKHLATQLERYAQVDGKQPQHLLTDFYAWADIFIFPTLQDGYPVVLAQAAAGALPIITTDRCSGPEILKENGGMGWIIPAADSNALVEKLRWCDQNRERVAEMVTQLHEFYAVRDWSAVAADFESVAASVSALAKRQQHYSPDVAQTCH